MSGFHGLQPSGWIHRRPDPRHLLQGVTIVTSSSRSITQHSLNIAMHISSVQFLDRLDPWNNMRDGPGKIFFQSFLREAIASSSGMGRNVHSLTLSIPLFPPANHGFVHPPRCREGWFREAVVEHTYIFSSFSWSFFSQMAVESVSTRQHVLNQCCVNWFFSPRSSRLLDDINDHSIMILVLDC